MRPGDGENQPLAIRPQVGTANVSIRGFTSGDTTNLLGDPPVALYLDGVYNGRVAGATLFSLVDLERVEILANFVALFGASPSRGGPAYPMLGTPGPNGTILIQPYFQSAVTSEFVPRSRIENGGIT